MMRGTTFVVASLLLGMGLVTVAPAGDAFAWCTFATHDDCAGNLACVGMWTDQYGNTHCQYAVPPPCQYCVPMEP